MSLAYSPSIPRQRGLSRVWRNTYDIDSPQALIQAQPGGDGTLESARLTIKALLVTMEEARVATAGTFRYFLGIFSPAAIAMMKVLFDPRHGFDYFTGTNDLANSQIAALSGYDSRQWQRLKKKFAAVGVLTYVHRSIKTGLEKAPGVDREIQISDIYCFIPDRMKCKAPELYAAFEQTLAQLKRERYARESRDAKEGKPPKRTLPVKRDKPKCRIPAALNPVGWARCIAALAAAKVKPSPDYAAREAEAIAFATRLARNAPPG